MKETRICPKCGSTDLKKDYHCGLSYIAGIPVTFKCKKCNFQSDIFPLINTKEVLKFRKKLKTK